MACLDREDRDKRSIPIEVMEKELRRPKLNNPINPFHDPSDLAKVSPRYFLVYRDVSGSTGMPQDIISPKESINSLDDVVLIGFPEVHSLRCSKDNFNQESSMPVYSGEAKRLLTKTEFELFRQSTLREIKNHTIARLRGKIKRSRRLRDKYKDLADQQRGEARGKRASKSTRPATDNLRTMRKVEIFDMLLERFEKRLARMEEEKRKEEARKQRELERKKKAAEKKRKEAEKKKAALKRKKEAQKRQAEAAKKKDTAKKTSRVVASSSRAASGPAGGQPPRSARSKASAKAQVRATRGHYRASQRRSQGRRDKTR